MKNALVTGGAGFIGSHLCERLLKEGYAVCALDNLYTGSRDNVAGLVANGAFALVEGDVSELEKVMKERFGEVPKFDEIYNLACPASPVHYQARPLFTTRTSFAGALNCLEMAQAQEAKVLHASTSEVYGDPAVHPQVEGYWGNVNTIGVRSCYDEGKRVAETLAADFLREFDTDVRMVRIFNTYGPRMHPRDGRVVSNFIVQALGDEDITIYGDGSQTRSFQYCDDLIEAMRRYMTLEKRALREFFGQAGRPPVPVINTGNPGEYTVRELAEKTLEKLPRSKSRIVYRPLPGDDPKKRRPDISLAKTLLGWEPQIPLDVGLDRTVAYFSGRVVLTAIQ